MFVALKRSAAFFKQVEKEFGSLDIFVSNARMEAPTFYQPPMAISRELCARSVELQKRTVEIILAAKEAVHHSQIVQQDARELRQESRTRFGSKATEALATSERAA